jgi:hypothetical protein
MAKELQVVEEQIDLEVLSSDFELILAADEGEADTSSMRNWCKWASSSRSRWRSVPPW